MNLALRLTYDQRRLWIGLVVLVLAQFVSTAANIKAFQAATGPHPIPVLGALFGFVITFGPVLGPMITAVAVFILVGKLPGT